ncbi:hypothetical protein ACFL29_01320 [Patescibacteria group bacterium]
MARLKPETIRRKLRKIYKKKTEKVNKRCANRSRIGNLTREKRELRDENYRLGAELVQIHKEEERIQRQECPHKKDPDGDFCKICGLFL